MVLYIDDHNHAEELINPSAEQLLESILSNNTVRNKANTFNNQSKKIESRLLYVCQGEYSAISFTRANVIDYIGTSGATTCHVIVIHDNETVVLAHLDSPEHMNSTIDTMTANMTCNDLSLYVIGGFLDKGNTSYPISLSLIQYFDQSEKRFNLQMWKTLALNTRFSNEVPFPIITDVTFNLRDRTLHEAEFTSRGPELELRNVLRYESEGVFSVFDNETGFIKIPYFDFKSDPRYLRAASAPDEFILLNCSTSPDCEPEYFCQDMRNLFHFIATKSSEIVFGPNKMPLIYQIGDDGEWLRQKII